MGVETEKFIRKPLYVDAVRVTPQNFDEIAAWCQGEVQTEEQQGSGTIKKFIKVRVHNPKNPRQTKAFIGDWILYTERGYKVYTNKAFRAAFDLVDGETPELPAAAPVMDQPQGITVNPDQMPKFYLDSESDELTETKPFPGAQPLTIGELSNIVRNELVGGELQQKPYPHKDGETIVLGPECFVAEDGSVLNWKGVNYVIQPEPIAEEPSLYRPKDEGGLAEPIRAASPETVTRMNEEYGATAEGLEQSQVGDEVRTIEEAQIKSYGPVAEEPSPATGVQPIESVTHGAATGADPEFEGVIPTTPPQDDEKTVPVDPELLEDAHTTQSEPHEYVEATPKAIADAVGGHQPIEIPPQPEPVSEQSPEVAAAGKRVLSLEEQEQMGPKEVRELLQTGEVVLEQDLAA